MKKGLMFILCLLTVVLFFAEEPEAAQSGEAGKLYFGGRGITTWGNSISFLPALENSKPYGNTSDTSSIFALHGSYQLYEHLSIQLESVFNSKKNMTLKMDIEESRETTQLARNFTYSAIDIPILLNVRFRPSFFIIGAFAGPYITIPKSKMKYDYYRFIYANDHSWHDTDISSSEYDIVGVTGGISVGGQVGIHFKSAFTIFSEIRYCQDLLPVTIRSGEKEEKVFLNKTTQLSIGCEFLVWDYKK